MSAYIVSKKTIDRIIFAVRTHPDIVRYLKLGRGKFMDKYNPHSNDDLKRLGQDLWALNTAAVNYRYNERSRVPRYESVALGASNSYQQVKTLRSFLYQCMEGDFPKKPLYKAMKQLSYDLAMDIVVNSSSYDNAEWE